MIAYHADRVFDILKENNPELTGEKRRTIMKPPQVTFENTQSTCLSKDQLNCHHILQTTSNPP